MIFLNPDTNEIVGTSLRNIEFHYEQGFVLRIEKKFELTINPC